MKIKLDDKYILNSDPYCYWITKEVLSETGKIREERVSGYHTEWEELVESLINHSIRGLDCTKLVKISNEIKELKRTVKKWTVNLSSLKENE